MAALVNYNVKKAQMQVSAAKSFISSELPNCPDVQAWDADFSYSLFNIFMHSLFSPLDRR